jgi:hypothetical protein
MLDDLDREPPMLREDKKIELVHLSPTLPRMFMGRWTLQSGKVVHPERWKDSQVETWRSDQQLEPVRLRDEGRQSLWWFRDRFFWDDHGHSAEDVKALALKRVRRDERRLKSARSLMKGEASGSPHRPPMPAECARAVVERDGLRCVQCGATQELQLDHVVPVALGGATSVENLQMLCSDCNLEKSDAL